MLGGVKYAFFSLILTAQVLTRWWRLGVQENSHFCLEVNFCEKSQGVYSSYKPPNTLF